MKACQTLALLCAAAMTCSPLTASADTVWKAELPDAAVSEESGEEGVMIYYVRNTGELPADIEIPSVFDGKPVYGIAESGFAELDEIVRVTIPGSILLIGEKAFRYCRNLQTVNFSSGLTAIDNDAFFGCDSLAEVVLPDTVTNLGYGVFGSCKSLESVHFSENLTTMGHTAFYKCASLTEVTLPASLETVGYQAFRSCTKLKTVTVSGPVCGEWMFADCPALESVTFLDRECRIDDHKSTVCNEATDVNHAVYNGVIRGYVGSTAEKYANTHEYRFEPLDPENVVTPPDVDYSGEPSGFDANHRYTADGICYEYMGGYVAACGYENSALSENLVIADRILGVPVQAVSEKAFSGMTGVQTVLIPLSVTEIGSEAFGACPDLKTVTVCNPDIRLAGGINQFSNDAEGNFTGVLRGYVPSELKGYSSFMERSFEALPEVRGDATLDGIVSIEDAQLTLKAYTAHVAGIASTLNAVQNRTMDADGSGEVSVEDAQLILRYYTENTVAGKNITWEDLLK